MTTAEKIYSAVVILAVGFCLASLASFHFLVIPRADDPGALYMVVSILWMIAVALTVTVAFNLWHRSLLVVPTIVQCFVLLMMVYFLPFAIWGAVLLRRRLQHEKDAKVSPQ